MSCTVSPPLQNSSVIEELLFLLDSGGSQENWGRGRNSSHLSLLFKGSLCLISPMWMVHPSSLIGQTQTREEGQSLCAGAFWRSQLPSHSSSNRNLSALLEIWHTSLLPLLVVLQMGVSDPTLNYTVPRLRFRKEIPKGRAVFAPDIYCCILRSQAQDSKFKLRKRLRC